MKFKNLLYSEEEEVFIYLMEEDIQQLAANLTGGALSQEGLRLLKINIATEIENLIIKIGNSTEGQIKDILNELKNEEES